MLTHWSYVFLALTHRCYTSQSIPRSLMTWRPDLGTTSHLWPPGNVAFLKRFHYNHTVTSSINPSTCIPPSIHEHTCLHLVYNRPLAKPSIPSSDCFVTSWGRKNNYNEEKYRRDRFYIILHICNNWSTSTFETKNWHMQRQGWMQLTCSSSFLKINP